MNRQTFRVVLDRLFMLLLVVLLLFGFVLLTRGGDKENVTRGIGLDPRLWEASGVTLMVFGSFLVLFVLVCTVGLGVARLRQDLRRQNLEGRIRS